MKQHDLLKIKTKGVSKHPHGSPQKSHLHGKAMGTATKTNNKQALDKCGMQRVLLAVSWVLMNK